MKSLRNYARPLLLAILALSMCVSTGCYGRRVVYVEGTSRVVELHSGDVIPAIPEGERRYMLSGAALVELMECCERAAK